MNHDIAYDAVSDAAEEASRLLAERRQDLYREMRRIRYADRRARSVWYGYDCLDEVQQAVLYRYYISRDCVKDIADSLHFSETTFWRKRREAMRRIQAICRQQTENVEK
ncbi:MAG: DUF1492 domain-containing protein [Eubacteriales bacterium]|nr:DUF1492 domain-containing protein [Eubacteriales bacterium]